MRSLASVFAFPLTFVLFGLSGTAPWSAEHVPAPEINVDAPVQGSVESALNAAVSLFTQGEVEAAIDAVRPYLSEDARTVDMLFEVGMITLGAAQTTPPSDAVGRDALLDSSIAVFRAILAAHPEFVRVRLELARAFFLKGRYGLARRNFELALAANPPAPVVANINRHLAMIQARRRWSGYFGMALAPDTNIGAAEDNETILVDAFGQRLPFVRNPEDRGSSRASAFRYGPAANTSSRSRRTGGCVWVATSPGANTKDRDSIACGLADMLDHDGWSTRARRQACCSRPIGTGGQMTSLTAGASGFVWKPSGVFPHASRGSLTHRGERGAMIQIRAAVTARRLTSPSGFAGR